MQKEPIKPADFVRVKNDTYGNPRYVCHFLNLDVYGYKSDFSISDRYGMAVNLSKKLGGRRFHNKQYGGGIVFRCIYNLDELCNRLNELMQSKGAAA